MKYINQIRYIKHTLAILTIFYYAITFAYDPYDCLNDVADIDAGIHIGLATELCSGTFRKN